MTAQTSFWPRLFRVLPYLLIAVGIFYRVQIYLFNCPLNADEACTAVDLLARNYAEIITNQFSYSDLPNRPIPLLLIDKLVMDVMSGSEFGLRLYPLLCSLLALILFWKVTAFFLTGVWRTVALGLFSVNEHLIFYAASVKQYSSDVLAAILALYMFQYLYQRPLDRQRARWMGLMGIVAIFFSYTVVFVLAALGMFQLLFSTHHKKFDRDSVWMVVYWLLGFGLMYIKYFRHMASSAPILSSASEWFLPVEMSAAPVTWTANAFVELMRHPVGVSWPYLGLVLFLVGCGVWLKSSQPKFIILVMPLYFVLLASAFKKYPFFERYILFVVPGLVLTITCGLMFLTAHARRWIRVMGWLCLAALLISVGTKLVEYRVSQTCHSNSRKFLTYFAEHYQPNDAIYVTNNSQFIFWYYGSRLGYNQRFLDEDLGPWYHHHLYGRQVAKIENYYFEDRGIPLLMVWHEKFGYSRQGVFMNKFPDPPETGNPRLIYKGRWTPVPGDPQGHIWLLTLHSTPEITRLARQWMEASADLTYEAGTPYNSIYRYERSVGGPPLVNRP